MSHMLGHRFLIPVTVPVFLIDPHPVGLNSVMRYPALSAGGKVMAAEHSPEESEERAFVVSDKRLFTPSGEKISGAGAAESAQSEAPSAPQREEAAATGVPPTPQAEGDAARDLPPVDFASFVMMLTNNVMVFLGQVPSPITQQPQVDLEQAQHTIDIIMMLREKTRGNLTNEEDGFLQELLPQLQMAYVQAKQQSG